MRARFEITTRCNLNCLHCGAVQYKTANEWTTAEAVQALDDMIASGIDQVDFLGGEPFMREDISELCSHLDEKGVSVSLSTNGLLLNEEIIDTLVNLNHLGSISFSIDGASKEVYETVRGENTYEKMLANLRALVSRKKETKSHFSVGLTCVVNGVNASETDALVELASQVDLDNVSFIKMTWVGNAEKNKDILYVDPQTELVSYEKAVRRLSRINRIRTMKGRNPMVFSLDSMPSVWKYHFIQKYPLVCQVGGKFQCQAGRGTFYVDASGVLYPCEAVKVYMDSVEAATGKYEPMSLPEHTFEAVKNSESFKKVVAYVQNKELLYKNATPCNTCKYSDGCSVCPLHAQSERVVHSCTRETLEVLN